MLRRNSSPLFVLALLAGLIFGTAPAQAHDTLVSVTPEDGGQVETAPAEAVLTFSGVPLDVSPQAVLQKDGETIETEPVSLDGYDLIVPLPKLEAGDYEIVYSVVSSDGHRIDGTTSFTVTQGVGGEEPSEAAADEAPDAPTEEATPTAVDDPVVAEDTESGDGAVTWIRWAGIIIVVLGIIALVSRAMRRRSSR